MKVAVISDIHGNVRALEAVLEDISHQGVDQIVCAGDVPNPLYRSLDTWLRLKELKIPVIRGNHEDYIVSYFSGDRPEILGSPKFLPIQLVAKHLGQALAQEFAALPFEMTISGPKGDDLYICHASPEHNARSFIRGVDAQMKPHLDRIQAKTLVAGHIHHQWTGTYGDKRLIICGSVGLPHQGRAAAQYGIFAHTGGEWRWDLRQVPYDAEGTMREYVDSGACAQGGPLAWLLYDELWCAEPRLALFLPRILVRPDHHALSVETWAEETERYLREIGRWDALKRIR